MSNTDSISREQFYKFLFSRSATELDAIIEHAIEFRSKSKKIRKSAMREALETDPQSKKLECITESYLKSDGSIYVSAAVPSTSTSEAAFSTDLSEEDCFKPALKKHLNDVIHYDSKWVRKHMNDERAKDNMNQSLHRKWTEFDVSLVFLTTFFSQN